MSCQTNPFGQRNHMAKPHIQVLRRRYQLWWEGLGDKYWLHNHILHSHQGSTQWAEWPVGKVIKTSQNHSGLKGERPVKYRATVPIHPSMFQYNLGAGGLGKGEGAQTLRCNLMNRLPSTQDQGEGTERVGLSWADDVFATLAALSRSSLEETSREVSLLPY